MRKSTAYVLLVVLVACGAGCTRPTEPNRPSADALTGDAKKLQGRWAIASIEDGRIENLTGDAKKDAEAMIKEVHVSFEGHRMTIVERGESEVLVYALNETKAPKLMTLTLGGSIGSSGGSSTARSGTVSRPVTARAGTSRSGTGYYGTAKGSAARPEPETWLWIYKFEGDALVVAFIKGDKKDRKTVPVDFKARAPESAPGKPAVPGVTVITLKRTNELPSGPSSRSTSRATSK
jgi:hypothetical protein